MSKWDAKGVASVWQNDFARKSKKYKSAYAKSLSIFLGGNTEVANKKDVMDDNEETAQSRLEREGFRKG